MELENNETVNYHLENIVTLLVNHLPLPLNGESHVMHFMLCIEFKEHFHANGNCN